MLHKWHHRPCTRECLNPRKGKNWYMNPHTMCPLKSPPYKISTLPLICMYSTNQCKPHTPEYCHYHNTGQGRLLSTFRTQWGSILTHKTSNSTHSSKSGREKHKVGNLCLIVRRRLWPDMTIHIAFLLHRYSTRYCRYTHSRHPVCTGSLLGR